MRRLVLALTVSAATLLAVSPAAASNPHHEEADGCDHGATGKECRPDPSPNGKDCEKHGKHGGINEDHCLVDQEVPTSTTTTTAPRTPITGPIELEVIEITTTSTMPAPATTTTTGPVFPTTTVTTSDGATGSPATTATSSTTSSPDSLPTKLTELPATGSSFSLGPLGLALVIFGIACIIGGRR